MIVGTNRANRVEDSDISRISANRLDGVEDPDISKQTQIEQTE